MTNYDIFIRLTNIGNDRFLKVLTVTQKNDNDTPDKLIGAVNRILQNVRVGLCRSYCDDDGEVKSDNIQIGVGPVMYWQYIEQKDIFVGPFITPEGLQGIAIIKSKT